jgi:hypothetical protein
MSPTAANSNGTSFAIPILSGVAILEPSFRATSAFGEPEAEPTAPSPTDRLVCKLANLLSLAPEELVENVYFIDGEDESHAQFSRAIEQVRALYQDRVQVAVTCYEVASTEQPSIGDAASPGEKPAIDGATVCRRRSPARIEATRSVSFIADWTPVVGDASVGIDPTIGTVTDGAAFSVLVGSGNEKARVGIQGVVAKVDVTSSNVQPDRATAAAQAASAPSGNTIVIGVPKVERRVFDTEVSVPLNRPTIVATGPGFTEGTRLVVAVTVKNVE